MALKTKLVFFFIRRQVLSLRKEGNVVLKVLDGWKNRIVVIVYVISILVALATGHDYRALADGLLAALGYTGTTTSWQIAMVVASQLWAIWGVIDTIRKIVLQRKAGATWNEVFSTPGYAKLAIKDGIIPPVPVKSDVPAK